MIIFTKTCERDLELLYYMVRSVAKHCTGYDKHVVMVDHKNLIPAVAVCMGVTGCEVVSTNMLPRYDCVVHPYLAQQYAKMMTDVLFVGESDGVCFQLDSDMIVERTLSVSDGPKHRWARVPRGRMPQGVRDHWDTRWWPMHRLVTGAQTQHAYMYSGCGWLLTYDVQREFRRWLEDRWGSPLHEILNNAAIRADDFSEYHAYGHFAEAVGYLTEPHWHTTTDQIYPEVWTFSGRVEWTKAHRIRLAAAIGEEPRP